MDYETDLDTGEAFVEKKGKKGKGEKLDVDLLSYMGAMDSKGKKKMPKGDVNLNLEDNIENVTVNPGEENLRQSFDFKDHGNVNGVFGNLGLMRRDIDLIKEQMMDIRRDFEHLSKTNRGERTLG